MRNRKQKISNWIFFHGGPLDGYIVDAPEFCIDCGERLHSISMGDIEYEPTAELGWHESAGKLLTVWKPLKKSWQPPV